MHYPPCVHVCNYVLILLQELIDVFDNVLDERNEPGWTATQVNNNYKMYYNYKCVIFTIASIYVQVQSYNIICTYMSGVPQTTH